LRKLLGPDAVIIIHEHNQNIADTMDEKKAMGILNDVDAYVGVSKFTMDYEITNKYPQFSEKAHYIRNGVNLEMFIPNWERMEERAKLRKKLGLSDNKVILFIGAIRERKGIHFLVRAMKDVIARHPEAKLVIVGGSAKNVEAKDPFAAMVRKEAEALGANCMYAGFVPSSEIKDMYLAADIFAGPSMWQEPFGLVFAEASASGLPVVSTVRGGIPEIIKNNVSGFLVNDPSDISSLSSAINRLLDDPMKAEEFGRAGRRLMESDFSWERVAGEIEDLYDSLIKKRR
jgi:spore coat protein SA